MSEPTTPRLDPTSTPPMVPPSAPPTSSDTIASGNHLKDFVLRHGVGVVLIVLGLSALAFMGHLFENQQVGINPLEFVLKAFGKIFYFGVAFIMTHVIIKYWFPTIYEFTHFTGGITDGFSKFRMEWRAYEANKTLDPRVVPALLTHVGIFASVCLLLALAF